MKILAVLPDVPLRARSDDGVDDPIPTFPLERILNIDTPVDDATLNGLSAVDVDDCTLNAKVDDVALIPATVPLSRSVDVPRVVADNHREAKPNVPPERDPEIPRDDVATQRVLVPVACSTIPSVPVALVES